jgi:Na+/melibiose symporter-like transporter
MNQEGVVWSFMNAITGGTVVTAFALHLQADSFAIGLLSALPLLAALFQLWTPQFVAFFGSRKTVCVLTAVISRLLWLPVALLAFAAWRWPDAYPGWLLLFLALVTLSAAFNSLTGSAWLSWAGAVVPLSQRASYFARRNLMVGFGGLVVSLLVGWLLDWWSEPTKTGRQPHPGVYMLLFSMAAVFGIFTVLLLRRTPDLMVASSGPRPRFKDSLLGTWSQLNLRKYLIFRSAWLFAVGIVVPYYTVYMLQNLRMSFTEIFLLQNIGAAAGLVGFTFWGRILDKYGCTRVLWWTSWLKVFYVIGWAFVGAGQPFWPLALLHLTLIIDSGMNLAAGNLLMNLMPNHNADNVGYFSVFTAVTSLVSAVGPFLAGLLIGLIAHNQLGLWGFSFDALQLMFLLSGLLRLLSLGLFRGFKEE